MNPSSMVARPLTCIPLSKPQSLLCTASLRSLITSNTTKRFCLGTSDFILHHSFKTSSNRVGGLLAWGSWGYIDLPGSSIGEEIDWMLKIFRIEAFYEETNEQIAVPPAIGHIPQILHKSKLLLSTNKYHLSCLLHVINRN